MIPPVLQDQIGGSDCEAIGSGLLAQPVNAITSGLYIVAAVVVFWRMPAQHRWRTGGLYSLLLALVGVGSVLYHGPQYEGSQQAHDLPIVGLLALQAAIVLVRWRRGTAIFPGASRGRLVALAVVAAIALLSYGGGRTGSPVCDGESLLQPHGLWHVCGSIAFVIVADLLFGTRSPGASRTQPQAAQASP